MGIPTPKEIQEQLKLENARVDWLNRKLELHEVKISLLRQLISINELLLAHLGEEPRPTPPVSVCYCSDAHGQACTGTCAPPRVCVEAGHAGCHMHSDGRYFHHLLGAVRCNEAFPNDIRELFQ